MKVHLMFAGRDFDSKQKPPPQAAEVAQDLELASLFAPMHRGDPILAEVAQSAVLASVTDVATIRYRQAVLRDCIDNEPVVRKLYDLVLETFKRKKEAYFLGGGRVPTIILSGSVGTLQILVEMLRKLRAVADAHVSDFQSDGLRTLFAMLQGELDDTFFDTINYHLKELKFQHGVLISGQLGEGNRGINYVLRKNTAPAGWFARLRMVLNERFGNAARPEDPGQRAGGAGESLVEQLFSPGPATYSFELAPRDDSGAQALSQLRDRGINLVANAVAQSTDHVLSFFTALRTELAFYIGCLNLHQQLRAQKKPICFPTPSPPDARRHEASGLYDVCLALNMRGRVVGNELAADDKDLVLITGANQGGKSTFLRSIGLAQVMMQCGMFVGATTFSANICQRIFTHYKREEDAGMNSGKFDEEIGRLSDIAAELTPNSIVLFNESFAATNEREGSEIARQVVRALLERRIKVFFVTHQYEFAHGLALQGDSKMLFLRAERQEDGVRTFRVSEGEPLETSYGEDLYERIFAGRSA